MTTEESQKLLDAFYADVNGPHGDHVMLESNDAHKLIEAAKVIAITEDRKRIIESMNYELNQSGHPGGLAEKYLKIILNTSNKLT